MGSDFYMNPPKHHVYYELSQFPWTPKTLVLFRVVESDYPRDTKRTRVDTFPNDHNIRRFAELVGIDIVEET